MGDPDKCPNEKQAARAGLSGKERALSRGTEGAKVWPVETGVYDADLPEGHLFFQSECTGRTLSSWRRCGVSGSRSTGPPVR